MPGPSRSGKRLDQLLVELGLFESREQARRAVLMDRIMVAGAAERRPGRRVPADIDLTVRPTDADWASRGGKKLAGALERIPIPIQDRVALDAGASTGGFTDVLLRHGARLVHSVDVGYGQLHYRLREDPRVVVLERRNARHLTAEELREPPDLLVADLSFISLRKVLPNLLGLLRPPWDALVLVKPQFEIGKGRVGRKGVVRSPEDHQEVLEGFLRWSAESGYAPGGACPSPIRGPKGNREFFVALAADPAGPVPEPGELARAVVEESHAQP